MKFANVNADYMKGLVIINKGGIMINADVNDVNAKN